MKSAKWLMAWLVMCVTMSFSRTWAETVPTIVAKNGIDWCYRVTDGRNVELVMAIPSDPLYGQQVTPINVTIPSNFPGNYILTSIGSNALSKTTHWKWTNMVEVTIPNGVTNIGDRAFYCCNHLRNVTMPDIVRNIGSEAFEGTPLTSIRLPQQLRRIGARAFWCCLYLRILTIPVSVEQIGKDAFSNCSLTLVLAPPKWEETAVLFNAGVPLNCETRYDIKGQTVTFDANGGTCLTKQSTYTAGYYTYGILPVATRARYSFAGWWSSPSGPGTQVLETSTVTTVDLRTLYARWTLLEQRVEFDANGGSCPVTNRICSVGSPYGALPEATREEYSFAGWWTQQTGGELIAATTIVSSEDTRTCYAHWTPQKQTVRFYPNGGTCDTGSYIYAVGETYSPLPDASREDYTFKGWWTSSSAGEQVLETDRVTEEETRNLYAHWSPQKQTVRFVPNGGTCEMESQTYSVGGTYSSLPDASLENYAFEGWWTSSRGGEQVLETDWVTEEKTRILYAHWLLTHQSVTFDANGGECSNNSLRYLVGAPYSSFPETVRDSYVFLGWWTLPSGGEQVLVTDLVPSVENRTLYAHWTEKERVVSFDPNGGECDTEMRTYTMGETYTPLPVATRDGYVFLGWFTSRINGEQICSSNVVTETTNFTLYAHWTIENEELWEYTVTNGMAVVTKGPSSGELTIPSTLGGYPVTGIGCDAFRDCSALTSVAIPDSVTSIESSAFYRCFGLTNVVLPGSVSNIDVCAFQDCTNLLSVILPDGVTHIGNSAFSRCRGLISVSIPPSVTNIGRNAFAGCSGLTSVTIYDLVAWCGVSFGARPFDSPHHLYLGGEEISKLVVPDGVRQIGANAFCKCSGLESVTIPDSVTVIGSGAFDGCSGLTSVNIRNLLAWCRIAFEDSMANPIQQAHHLYMDGEEITNLTIPDSVTRIGSLAFSGCYGLTNVMIPCSVASIEGGAFETCTNLLSVTIPNSVTNIGSREFYGCNSLRDVVLPDSVTRLGSEAFSRCYGLTNMIIPESVTGIEDKTFDTCTNLASVTIPISVTNIGSWAFSACSGLRNVTIPESVTCIEGNAFEGCANLTSLSIPDSVTSIGGEAFRGCGLTNVVIPASVTYIARNTFLDCTNLVSVSIPQSVTKIGWQAFRNCVSLTAVTIPGSVTKLGDGEFYCSGLTSVTISEGVTCLDRGVFQACTNLTSVRIPTSVTNIGSYVFSGCSSLITLTIPASVTTVGNRAFSKCSGLKRLYVPASWDGTSILENAEVPSGCKVVYRDTLAETVTTPVPVEYGWLADQAAAILATNDGDYEAAAKAVAANGMPVWKCYVAGMDPTDSKAKFKVQSIMVEDGKVEVKWNPDLNENGGKLERSYVLEGKPAMLDEWGPTNAASRFFRVKVEMLE